MLPKVLYVIDTLQTGGAERSTLDIAARLQAFQAVVCQVYEKDDLSREYNNTPIVFEKLGITGKYEFRKAVAACRAVIRKHKPALVIGTLMRAEIIARIAAKKEGVPVLGTFVNDTYSKEALDSVSGSLRLKIRFFQLLNAFTARYCEAFLANAEAIKWSNARALRISPEKIIVIHRGRDVSKFGGTSHRKINKPLHFLNVGRLLERKGQMDLLNAFKNYVEKFPGSKLTIAGDGPYRPVLESAIAAMKLQDSVSLAGNVSNVSDWLRQADCFIFPSHYEGFSGALVEASLSGIPVIASDISMNKEVMPEGGCIYFEMKNSADLFLKMEALQADTENALEMASVAQQYARKHFDIAHIVALHEAAYAKYGMLKS